MSEQESNEPTLANIMSVLTNLSEKFGDVESRLEAHESILHEIQPRLSILFEERDKRSDGSLKNDSEDEHESEDLLNTNKNRSGATSRKTMFERKIEETSKLAERHTVVVQRQTPNHSDIFLNSTDLAEYATFVNKWFDWEIRHGIKLEPALIVSKNVRNQLMYNNGKTETDFNALTPSAFCSLMAKETRVYSKVQFAETFRNAMRDLKVLAWERIRPSSHERFFQGILRRQKLFMRTFQILMEANKDYCPTLEGKEFGLAQIFLNLIDKDYNKYILAEIPKVKDFNFKKLSDFVDAYVEKANEHFQASRLIKLVPYQGSDFKDNPSERSQTSFRKPFQPKQAQFQPGDNKFKRLNYVDVTVENDDSDDGELSQTVDMVDSQTLRKETQESRPNSAEEDDIHSGVQQDSNEHEDQQLQALNDKNDYVKGCVNYALYGNCFLGEKCKNVQGHNEAVAKNTRQWMLQKLTTPPGMPIDRSKTFRSAESSQFPRKIMHRDKQDNSRNYE